MQTKLQPLRSSIPLQVNDLGPVEMTPRLDMKLGVIPHPGVSALKKEHGVLTNRPNISEIGKFIYSHLKIFHKYIYKHTYINQ